MGNVELAGTSRGSSSASGDLTVLTPNQLVAYNLQRARTMRGWTQEQAAERLEPFIGKRWSKASWSSAERSVTGERPREFTADELIAFARCFELPPPWFLSLPLETKEVAVPGPAPHQRSRDYLAMLVRGKRLEARAEEIEEALRDARDATERLDRLHQQIYGRVHESELPPTLAPGEELEAYRRQRAGLPIGETLEQHLADRSPRELAMLDAMADMHDEPPKES
jgi:transcriptional regulator with XRE-family HTH domain